MSDVKPIYLLAGGRPKSPGMTSCLSQALSAAGHEKPRVAYVGTASKDNLLFFAAIKALLKEAGSGDVTLVRLSRPKSDVDLAKRTLEAADAIFISGGEVEDGIKGLVQHAMDSFIKELYSKGKVLIGVSAGSIMLGSHWVRWEKEDDDSTASLFECLGLVPTVFDTHAEDEDWKELKLTLKLLGPGARGFGIPRDGMASADVQGNLNNHEKALLPYVNREGQVEKSE
jgi:peptidase E